MNIIFMSNGMAKAKSLSHWQVALIVAGLMLIPSLLILLTILPYGDIKQQGVKTLLPSHLQFSLNNPQKHLDAYALELGELQARILRLDAQSARLAKLAGEKDNAIKNNPNLKPLENVLPGRGGPLVRSSPLSEAELKKGVDELITAIDGRDDYLSVLESKLLQQSVLKGTLPNSSPVDTAYNSSSYGWRIDPFTGSKAFHEGLDFTAAIGTPIHAAAGGIVVYAEQTPDYGKIIKIDHGSGLETRYAHASQLLVKVGDRVEKGQVISLVGSTGRSTGAHLHYEIRLNGEPLDPRKYLQANAG